MQSVSIADMMGKKAMSKLRNGLPVRIKAGGAINLGVSADRIHAIKRAFNKGKAHTLALMPHELQHNMVSGSGIFGKKFDSLLQKSGVKKLAYAVGDAFKPAVKAAIDMGAATAMTEAPFLSPAIMSASSLAKNYLDKPSDYIGGSTNVPPVASATSFAEQEALSYLNKNGMGHYASIYENPYASLNQYTGYNFGNIPTAVQGSALSNLLNQDIQNIQGMAREKIYSNPLAVQGLNAASVLQSAMMPPYTPVNYSTGMPNVAAVVNQPTNPNQQSMPANVANTAQSVGRGGGRSNTPAPPSIGYGLDLMHKLRPI